MNNESAAKWNSSAVKFWKQLAVTLSAARCAFDEKKSMYVRQAVTPCCNSIGFVKDTLSAQSFQLALPLARLLLNVFWIACLRQLTTAQQRPCIELLEASLETQALRQLQRRKT